MLTCPPLTALRQVWDARRRSYLHTISTKYPITSTCFGGRDDTVIVGGLDNTIHVYDLRNLGEVITLRGHTGAGGLCVNGRERYGAVWCVLY